MRAFASFFSFLMVILVGLVLGRYAWAKYVKGQPASIAAVMEETKNNLLTVGGLINQEAERVLGVQNIREELPKEIKDQIEKSAIVEQVQQEITTLINNTGTQVKDLPKQEMAKIRKDVAGEICKQLLK